MPIGLTARQAGWRLLAVVAMASALLALPALFAWLEGVYPPGGGAAGMARYVIAAMVTWGLAVLTAIAWAWPSWVIAARMRPSDTTEVRALRATVIAFLLQPVLHAVIIAVAGRELPADRYRLVTLVAQIMLLAGAAILAPRRTDRAAGWDSRLAAFATVLFLASLALVSRIAWADLNPDGTELLTMGSSHAAFIVPRLPTGEIPGINLGMLPIAYPIDWLLAIGGLSPVAARLPALAYIALIGAGVGAVVEQGAARRLSAREFATLLAGVAAVCLTIGFNASYDPYSADLASPPSIDFLALVFLVATLYFLFAGETAWCVAAAVLQALSRPSAFLLCVMLAAALLIVERDVRSTRLRLALIATATTVLVSVIYVFAIETFTGSEVSEGGGNLLLRIRFLRFDDWRRFAWLVIPGGIVPALIFSRWRHLDLRARTLALVSLAYFAFFYSLAFIALHHFAPAMLLPLVVFWRYRAQRAENAGPLLTMAAAGVAIAVVVALPRSPAPYRASRGIGQSIAFNVGNAGGYAHIRNTFDGSRVLDSLFAPYWRVRDPQVERVGDPLSLAWYAAKARPSPASARYVVQPETLAPPAGTTPLGTARGFALYTRDVAAWRHQRATPPPPDARSRLYDVPRTTLFQHVGRDAGMVQLDLRDVACGLLKRLPGCTTRSGT